MVSNYQSSTVSKASALRILKRVVGASVKMVQVVRKLANKALQVTYKVGASICSTFLSPKTFDQDFADYRAESAKSVEVRPYPSGSYKNHYECKSSDSCRYHTVQIFTGKVGQGLKFCSCEDYSRQLGSGNKTSQCKHILAVESFLTAKNIIKSKKNEFDITQCAINNRYIGCYMPSNDVFKVVISGKESFCYSEKQAIALIEDASKQYLVA